MFRKAICLAIVLASIGLTACNTMAGLGRDIERGGDKLEDAAERGKRK